MKPIVATLNKGEVTITAPTIEATWGGTMLLSAKFYRPWIEGIEVSTGWNISSNSSTSRARFRAV